MTTALAANGNGALAIDDKSLFALVTDGDCSKLTDPQKLAYYRARCDAAGLDYRAQPFQFVKLNGKLVLYALKAASDQLAAKHGLSVRLVETPADVQELAASGGCRAFTARVTGKDGRETDDVGVVTIKSASGDTLANVIMKGATKAKRRAVLAHQGLGMLDETEIETIPRAQPIRGAISDDTLERDLRASVKQGAASAHAGQDAAVQIAPPGDAALPPSATAGENPVSPPAQFSQVDPHELLAARLIEECEAGFYSKEKRFAWWAGHLAEINSLPKEFARAVVRAYDLTRLP